MRLKPMETEMKNYHRVSSENKKLRKLLFMHQSAFGHQLIANADGSDNLQCPHCPKSFYDIHFLTSHIERRHTQFQSDQTIQTLTSDQSSLSVLSLTQKISDYHTVYSRLKNANTFSDELTLVKEKLEAASSDLETERQARLELERRIETELESKVRKGDDSISQSTFMTSSDDLAFIDENDPGNSSNCTSPVPLTGSNIERLMLHHTQEVHRLGSNIELLANKIANSYTTGQLKSSDAPVKNSIESSLRKPKVNESNTIVKKLEDKPETSDNISEKKDKDTIENIIKDKVSETIVKKNTQVHVRHRHSSESDSEDCQQLTHCEIHELVNGVLEAIGVNTSKSGIQDEEYRLAMSTFRDQFLESSTDIKRNLKRMIANEIKKRTLPDKNIQNRVGAVAFKKSARSGDESVSLPLEPQIVTSTASSSADSKQQPRVNQRTSKFRVSRISSDQIDQQGSESNIVSTSAKKSSAKLEQPTEATEQQSKTIPILPIDEEMNKLYAEYSDTVETDKVFNSSSLVKELKSVLKSKTREHRKDRRISFNETRIEISPEHSVNGDDNEATNIIAETVLADKNSTAPKPKPRSTTQPHSSV